MFIVMHCGGMPFNGNTLRTQSLGGSETAAGCVAIELAKLGHKVILFTNSQEEGTFDGVKYSYAGEPVQGAPLGDRFHFFVQHTPHDLCITQRHPQSFVLPQASKVNFWWLHDLALIPQIPIVNSQLWNIDRTMVVSDWHVQQVNSIYGIPMDRLIVSRNGVDGSLYENAPKLYDHIANSSKVELVYTSRPERGLEHLLRPGGIMERLEEKAPGKFHLTYCTYANFPQHMIPYYEVLKEYHQRLSNVTSAGCLPKSELASLQIAADVWCYPTEFDEVSCITAMEAVAAGLQIVASDSAAIGETLREMGVTTQLIPLRDGVADEDAFVERLLGMEKRAVRKVNPDASPWRKAAEKIERAAYECMGEKSPGAIARHLIRTSDIYAFQKWMDAAPLYEAKDSIVSACIEEVQECYGFAFDNKWKEHYQRYYQYEKDRGVNYGPEKLDGNTRFEAVCIVIAKALAEVPGDSPLVLDYGCAHGHYTVNLAKRFPHARFIGVDIEQTNVDKARKWAMDDGVTNVAFYCGTSINIETTVPEGPFDVIIAAEVLEHLEDVGGTVDKLASFMLSHSTMVITTPFGPWEYIGAIEHFPWRAHVHHLERADLYDLFGAHPGFKVQVATANGMDTKEPLGSYVTTFRKPVVPSGAIDYKRKILELVPRQTISLCMIVKNGEESLLKAVKSVLGHVDEVIIGIDKTTTDGTEKIVDRLCDFTNECPMPVISNFNIDSPMETGFDVARNTVIEKASGDWILWIDADEHVEGMANLVKYLRNNQYNGYAVDHIHLSVDPPGAIRIDKPTRIFRNRKGIKFYGVVHEHPEIVMNTGVGQAVLIPDVKVSHVGYSTESVRIRRFYRNIDLMARDREKYPDRQLGKFLWVRDLSMMCRFELEGNGGRPTKYMMDRAEAGTKLFEELIDTADERMLLDGLEYYTVLSTLLGGVQMNFQLALSKHAGQLEGALPAPANGVFRNKEQALRFINRIFNERTRGYESKYG